MDFFPVIYLYAMDMMSAVCVLQDLESTINDLDLDLILQSIHASYEPLGIEEIQIRFVLWT